MMPTKNNKMDVAGAANAPAVGGNASIEDVLNALSPQDAALLQQGIDPFGADQVPMESLPQVPLPTGQVPMPAPAPNALDTIKMLQQILGTIPQDSQMGAVAAGSIQTAIDALGAGAQGAQQPLIR